MMMPQEKVPRGFTEGDEDRISQLTDDLIGNILSRLPTIEAVKTCVLSKDWEHKWTFISKIEMNSEKEGWDCEERVPSFVNFVQRMFQLVGNVTTLYFRCVSDLYDESVLTSIISDFLKYKADMLHIDVGYRLIVISGRLFSWQTLREMELHLLCIEFPSENCFPHLTTLCLDSLEISVCEPVISNEIEDELTLRFTFPVLKILQIFNCTWPDVRLVEIHAPSLQKLELCTDFEDGVGYYYIKICGATGPLFYDSYGDYLDDISFIGSNLVSANIQHSDFLASLDSTEEIVRDLVRGSISTLVDLKLSPYIAQFFVKALLESKHGFSLLVFDKLERFTLCVDNYTSAGSTEALFDLLHAMPCLKFLEIQNLQSAWGDYDYDTVESIPSCLLSTMKEIKLNIWMGEDDKFAAQIRLAKFLLQTGEKAKLESFDCQMHVVDLNYFHSDRLMEQISSFPRAPPHFTLCAMTYGWPSCDVKHFSYRESGWVEDV